MQYVCTEIETIKISEEFNVLFRKYRRTDGGQTNKAWAIIWLSYNLLSGLEVTRRFSIFLAEGFLVKVLPIAQFDLHNPGTF